MEYIPLTEEMNSLPRVYQSALCHQCHRNLLEAHEGIPDTDEVLHNVIVSSGNNNEETWSDGG